MQDMIRPVRMGILIGLLTLLFGIVWAFFLVLQHERIHSFLENSARAHLEEKFLASGHQGPPPHEHQGVEGKSVHEHGSMTHEGPAPMASPAPMEGAKPHSHGDPHENPLIETAHERLTRGHLHAMGLGVVTVSLSLLISFLGASDRVKTAASVFLATGGFFYPFAWIIMGLRTPSLGIKEAEVSVMPVAGPSVALVATGIIIAIVCLLKGAGKRR